MNLLDRVLNSFPVQAVKNWLSTPYVISSLPKNQPVMARTPSITPTPTPTITPPNMLEQAIRKGLEAYGGANLPVMQHVPQMVQAAQRYPIFKYNPYMLPQMSILETSAGRNITRPNNVLNWGINVPGNNQVFATMKPGDVLERAISGMGGRSPYYQPFRVNRPLNRQEIENFAKVYEPNNPDYGRSLWEGMKVFGNN